MERGPSPLLVAWACLAPALLGHFALPVARIVPFPYTLTGLTLAVVFLLAADRVFIPYEERKLAAAFGPEYEAFKMNIRRWI